jgi:hypothetical protein
LRYKPSFGGKMGLGKTFRKSVKSGKNLQSTYEVCKKLCLDSKLNMKQDEISESEFVINASEPMKWLSTNWPNSILMRGEVFDDKVMVSLEAESKGVSITQDRNIADFLDNFAESLEKYVS